MRDTLLKYVGLIILNFIFTNFFFVLNAQKYSLGVVATDEDKLVKKANRPLGFGENMPTRVDLSMYVPYIADQGNTPTAVAYASTHTVATMEWAILTNTTDKSVIAAQAYDPYHTYLYTPREDGESCTSGISLYFALEHLIGYGSKRRFDDALSCDSDVSFDWDKLFKDKDRMTIEFETFYSLNAEDQDLYVYSSGNVRASLAEGHPVVLGLYAPDFFFDIGSDGLFEPSEREREDPIGESAGLHAMAIVGYDDEFHGGCFKVANSWGTSWGDNGYCYIQYDDFNTFLYKAYDFETKLKYNPSDSPGCIYGNCSEGYGVFKNIDGGVFEGQFTNSKPTKGVYVTNGLWKSKYGKKYMKKLIKANGGYYLFDNYGSKRPIGCSVY